MKPILVSGIQPTGALHLGNYLGALKHFVELQNSGKYRCFFFIADLHALTQNPDPRELKGNIENLMRAFLAAGLDPRKSTLFIQSATSFPQELAQVLATFTPVSELMRMTAFKEKVIQKLGKKETFEEVVERSNFGLAEYPILMAADIFLYDAAVVPVGDDQDQHLELARTLARKFNVRFGKTFVEPKALHTDVPRLMSLDDPAKKMSKSRPAGCLFMDDSLAEIRAKFSRATTDSGREIKYDEKDKPGVSNLLLIYSSLSGESIPALERRYTGKGYADFKDDLANVAVKTLVSYQTTKKKISAVAAKTTFTKGTRIAIKVAQKKMVEVKKKIGLA
ncbi:MAG: tryptophan--tRNA ligase [Candidatus Brennerbacteria bacterium]|nr:tryptophan--tRNA ligase [Candidatus Brennerbacteria bacterium]